MWLLQRDERITYRTLKYILRINDAVLEEVCEELFLKRLAVDEDGQVFVWTGAVKSVGSFSEITSTLPTIPETLATPASTTHLIEDSAPVQWAFSPK